MNYSLYIHIPFCKHRCHYCDFNTYAGKEKLIPVYIDSLIKELRIVSEYERALSVHSIFFGGGTPSLVPIKDYIKILDLLRKRYSLTIDCEISLEANPGTLSQEYLLGLKKVGFTRISIGIQSTHSSDLVRLDRVHNVEDILNSVKFARKVGFDNVNFDMIFGLPWQKLSGWENALSRAIALHPDHLSLYSLIIEPGTPFHNWFQRGLIAPQDQDLEGDMYESAMTILDQSGYDHYEISNWAKKNVKRDYRCRHNLQYWLNQPYLGFGAGAHGFTDGLRTENTKTIHDYIHRMRCGNQSSGIFPTSPATASTTSISLTTQMKDFMLLGLRLIQEGVSSYRFKEFYGCSMENIFNDEIQTLIKLGLVQWQEQNHTRLRLTKRGVMVANQVFMAFL